MNDFDWDRAPAPSLDDFAALAEAALARLPQPFRGLAGAVRMHVADFAEPEMLDELGIEDAFDLTGVYSGVDLRRQSVLDPTPHPSTVFLYRRPILDEWAARGVGSPGTELEFAL